MGVIVTGSVSASQAETLRVVGFNVESGGADPNVVDDLIARVVTENLIRYNMSRSAPIVVASCARETTSIPL